jgi:hypothetical protein
LAEIIAESDGVAGAPRLRRVKARRRATTFNRRMDGSDRRRMRPTRRDATWRRARPAVAVGLALLCAGLASCASLVKGSAQTIAIRTDPPGAACTLTRAGQNIGDVDPTPATVSVFKSGAPIVV